MDQHLLFFTTYTVTQGLALLLAHFNKYHLNILNLDIFIQWTNNFAAALLHSKPSSRWTHDEKLLLSSGNRLLIAHPKSRWQLYYLRDHNIRKYAMSKLGMAHRDNRSSNYMIFISWCLNKHHSIHRSCKNKP